jgi:hypothetical protein
MGGVVEVEVRTSQAQASLELIKPALPLSCEDHCNNAVIGMPRLTILIDEVDSSPLPKPQDLDLEHRLCTHVEKG